MRLGRCTDKAGFMLTKHTLGSMIKPGQLPLPTACIIILCLAWFSAEASASQSSFQYSGYLESDSKRPASMNLSISGTKVTGNLSLRPVCQSNARLPGTEFNLSGEVSGTWEGNGFISGSWTGVVTGCEKSENRSGSFTISLGQGSVYFNATGSYYNRYVFSALGKVNESSSSSPGAVSAGGSTPAETYEAPSYGSLPPPSSGFGIPAHMRNNMFGVVEMNLNETRLFNIPLGGSWFRTEDFKRIESFSNCYDTSYMSDPGNILHQGAKVGDAVNVKAVGEGIGKVWADKGCYDCLFEGGGKGRCNPRGVWLVVVGEKGYQEYTGKKRPTRPESAPESDIAKASLKGRVVMVGTKKPVANAQISLIGGQGGAHYRDDWKSGVNGKFSFRADNILNSGVYEVMAQLRSPDMGTAANPSTVHKDLWPVKKYLVTITRDSVQKGSIDVGDIEMNTVLSIFGGWDLENNTIIEGSGRDGIENRTPVTRSATKGSPPQKPSSKINPEAPGYNPLGDPNLKSPPSRNSVDVAGVDKLGHDFQDGYNKTKKMDGNASQVPVAQPDSYTGGMRNDPVTSQPDSSTGYSPYEYPQAGGGGPWISVCDNYQKNAAYRAGRSCGNKAKQNRATMTRDCSSALQTYRNMEANSGWGTCLSDAFRAGYREAPGQTSLASSSSSAPQAIPKITAELENKAGDNVHIFIEGQDNFGPQNKLGPGQKRMVTLNISAGQSVKFAAGRNGQVLARCSWAADSGTSGLTAYVRFSAPDTLTCTKK